MIDRLLDDPVWALQNLVLMAPGLLLAVTVHEVAHGWVADRLGDPTPRLAGRLTLNPLPHLDPLGALAFVISSLAGVGFGWARPVPVSAGNFQRPRRDMALVAAAGPLSNFALAFVGLIAWILVKRTLEFPFVAAPLAGILSYVFTFNLGLAIFNLIPLPPLDGGHFLPYVLPRSARRLQQQLYEFGPFILILLIVSGATGYLIGPVFRVVLRLYLAAASLLL